MGEKVDERPVTGVDGVSEPLDLVFVKKQHLPLSRAWEGYIRLLRWSYTTCIRLLPEPGLQWRWR